jgi:hypothetical protein
MKYLAILKDSLREAIDTKVFFVMAGLSLLLILVVASVSFQPVSVEDDVKQLTSILNWAMSWPAAQGQPVPHFDHADFRQLNPEAEPWKGDYTFTFLIKFPDEETAKRGRRGRDFSPRDMQRNLRQHFGYLENLEVTEGTSEDPLEHRLVVTSTGTKIDNIRGWKHKASLFFGAVPMPSLLTLPLGEQVFFIENTLVNSWGGWVAILIGIIVTAFFIPNMLRKGTVDLLLVKPINRVSLLVFKYIGGLAFMLVNSALVVGGIWLVLGLRAHIWAPGFLLTILVLTFFFAILYSVSTLFAVLARSPIVAILMACLTWGILLGVGTAHTALNVTEENKDKPDVTAEEPGPDFKPPSQTKWFPEWVYTAVGAAHYVLPRSADLNALTGRLIINGVLLDDNPKLKEMDKTPFSWVESLTVSGGFIALMLCLACWRFAVTDY